jgi:hypothetical protein
VFLYFIKKLAIGERLTFDCRITPVHLKISCREELLQIRFLETDIYVLTLNLGFRRDIDVICGLLDNYTAPCGNYLPTFRDNVSVPSSRVKIPNLFGILTREDGTDTLSRNVGK